MDSRFRVRIASAELSSSIMAFGSRSRERFGQHATILEKSFVDKRCASSNCSDASCSFMPQPSAPNSERDADGVASLSPSMVISAREGMGRAWRKRKQRLGRSQALKVRTSMFTR